MTQPTQAQIEAAAKALYGDHGKPPSDKAQAMAKAALTAAAQVGGQPFGHWWEEAERTIERDTIERCAQVADAELEECKQHCVGEILMGQVGAASRIAAAIRKLKDAP